MADVNIPIQTNLGPKIQLDLGNYITSIIGFALTLSAITTLIYLIWGGISWMTASGDEKKVEAAKGKIGNAVAGLAIVAVSWAIFLVLDTFFGLNVVK